MSSTELSPPPSAGKRERAGRALRARHNWEQLFKFCVVGGSGFFLNLLVFDQLVHHGVHHLIAATISFVVAAANNYLWNRLWTFRHQRGHVGAQGARFFVVSALAWLANLAFLSLFIWLGLPKLRAQAIAIVLVTPVNFLGNKLWSFRK
jgi:putative flippase GtrA